MSNYWLILAFGCGFCLGIIIDLKLDKLRR